MLAGAALAAAALQTLHAQAKPPAFVVAEITAKDQEVYAKFLPVVTKSIQSEGGKFIAGGGKTVSFSGAAPAQRVVIVQYDSLDKAQQWWNDETTKELFEIGSKYADIRQFAIEGTAP